jgi:DNA adenine methylase
VPRQYGTYHEPFVGGGALVFHLKPRRAVLTDRNERLIRTYRGIRDHVDDVIEMLDGLQRNHSKDLFTDLRQWPIDEGSDVEVAAWMIYLNKAGFNGLYRVNSRNLFNVPFGNNPNVTICDSDNVRACAEVLAGAELVWGGFEGVLDRAGPGDFVYCDPPYAPVSPTANFTSYTKDGFDGIDQARLADVARALKRRGVTVVLSNSDTPEIRRLYGGGTFELHEVQVPRSINSKASGRGKVPELVIC